MEYFLVKNLSSSTTCSDLVKSQGQIQQGLMLSAVIKVDPQAGKLMFPLTLATWNIYLTKEDREASMPKNCFPVFHLTIFIMIFIWGKILTH